MRRLLIIPALVGVLSLGLVARPAHAIPLPPGTETLSSRELMNCSFTLGGVTFTNVGPASIGIYKLITGQAHFASNGDATYLFGPCKATLAQGVFGANETIVTSTGGARVNGKGTFVHGNSANLDLVESWQAFGTFFGFNIYTGSNVSFSDFFTWQQNFTEDLEGPGSINQPFGGYDLAQNGVITKFANQGFGSYLHTGTGTVCDDFVDNEPQCDDVQSGDFSRHVVFQVSA